MQAGRTAIAPEILLTLWFFALIEGVGSARELERRTERDIAYRWICGGVSKRTLENLQEHAKEHLEKLTKKSESETQRLEGHARRDAARKRAAQDRAARLVEALKQQRKATIGFSSVTTAPTGGLIPWLQWNFATRGLASDIIRKSVCA